LVAALATYFSTYGLGLAGLRRGIAGIGAQAREITRARAVNDDTGELARSMTGIKQHQHAAKASVAAIESADQAQGSLIDVLV